MASSVITRFAPSPTGYLHIGGARTALFNWLFSRHHGGQFLLRIEDTDRERSTEEATAAIYRGLEWLGLNWDGDLISQSSRIDAHREAAEQLLTAGQAYRCYATPEEIDAARQAARDSKQPFRFHSPWRDRDPAEAPADAPCAIRLRAPTAGQTTVTDAVQGEVVWKNSELDDLVLLRSDGTPTYMLAVVVDDHDMGITHVIRGADHLTNAARQSLIYDAFGWTRPVFAHIPLIHGPDGKKYSKRHGAVGLDEFAADGFLPEAMRNYLSRLGWSHGDEEFFSTEQAIEWFSLDTVGRSAARFDSSKLLSLNADHLRATSTENLLDIFTKWLADYREISVADEQRTQLERILPELVTRARTLVELAEMANFILCETPVAMDEKAAKLLSDDNRASLAELTTKLEAVSSWTHDELENAVKQFAEAKSLSLGKVAQPLRAALTGRTASPGIFDVMLVLGREETLARANAWRPEA